jgi:prepilin-type N-terminal cleavage/methylation domain-containing protein
MNVTNTPRSRQAFTLIEILVALAIFGILIAVASGAIVQYLRVQSDQEAITSAQAKLRRVTELLSQEMRSAVFGGIFNTPYTSDTDNISFLLLDGGAGYPIVATSTTSLDISSSAADTTALGVAPGDQLLMLTADGAGLLFRANTVTQSGLLWRVTQPAGCTNSFAYTTNTTLFKVRTFAVRYDKASTTLFASESAGEQTLAWNITDFKIDYVYQDSAGNTEIDRPGFPARTLGAFNLQRLQIVAETIERSRGRDFTRTYSTQIELPNTNQVSIGGLTVCP